MIEEYIKFVAILSSIITVSPIFYIKDMIECIVTFIKNKMYNDSMKLCIEIYNK